MSVQTEAPASVRAPLNFAADRTDGGIWSNLMRHLITQALEGREVEIRDARRLPGGPSLEKEGFVLTRTPAPAGADFTNKDWVAGNYAPQCLKLVQDLTGAAHVAPFYGAGVLIRDTGNAQAAPAAEFVHLDQTRESIRPFLEQAANAEVRSRWPRVKIFNVWRPLTPPPQDVPLALCDQRTLDPRDWVVGRTVEPNFPDGVPYVSSVFNPDQRWFYLSDLTPDDAVVFKGYDSDPAVRLPARRLQTARATARRDAAGQHRGPGVRVFRGLTERACGAGPWRLSQGGFHEGVRCGAYRPPAPRQRGLSDDDDGRHAVQRHGRPGPH